VAETIEEEKKRNAQFDKLADKIAELRKVIEKSQIKPKQVFFNDEDGVVAMVWSDGLRSKATCDDHDSFDVEVGIAFCIAKRLVGKKNYKKLLERAQFQPTNNVSKDKPKSDKIQPVSEKKSQNKT